jgi:hypothetical protein
VNWYLAVETEDPFVFVNRETGEVILWESYSSRRTEPGSGST